VSSTRATFNWRRAILPLRTQLRAGLASAAPDELDRKSRWKPGMSPSGTRLTLAAVPLSGCKQTFTRLSLEAKSDPQWTFGSQRVDELNLVVTDEDGSRYRWQRM
jgi:hypothetical protein